MRKLWLLLPVLGLLWGCARQEVFERVEDLYQVRPPVAGVIAVDVPADALVTAMATGEDSTIYFCDGYTLTVQTLAGGDLGRTVTELTGFGPEAVTLVQTRDGELKRYEGTWICAGEGGDQVGQLVLLDDGGHHYAVTVMAPAARVGQLRLVWDSLLDSVTLRTDP